jgi:hypothetical protein
MSVRVMVGGTKLARKLHLYICQMCPGKIAFLLFVSAVGYRTYYCMEWISVYFPYLSFMIALSSELGSCRHTVLLHSIVHLTFEF